ncbi:MAG: hypothetical protein Q8942_07085 [Bacillota bacterium]|nr:hypothetical protein [Bacillota bacterium]
MYKIKNWSARKNFKAFGLVYEPGINLYIHWLNPLFVKHKSS